MKWREFEKERPTKSGKYVVAIIYDGERDGFIMNLDWSNKWQAFNVFDDADEKKFQERAMLPDKDSNFDRKFYWAKMEDLYDDIENAIQRSLTD